MIGTRGDVYLTYLGVPLHPYAGKSLLLLCVFIYMA